MNLPFYIAKRYLFAKKSQTAVNVLTLVSVVGVSIGTMALVIILSVFNGFERLVLSMFNAFNPDIEIKLVEGKSFDLAGFPFEELEKMPGVLYVGKLIEETALLTHKNRQHIVNLRGVDDSFSRITGLDTMILEGDFLLEAREMEFLVVGQGVAHVLGLNINDLMNPLNLYVPKKGRVTTLHPAHAFNASTNFASGVFGIQADLDMQYVIAPYSLVQELAEYNNRATSVILSLSPDVNPRQVQRQIAEVVGPEYMVRNRFQQEEFLYRVMRSEKWAIFLILSFIMVIAAFNITGSLTMLVLEKRHDIAILWSMGASQKTIKQIFMAEGLLIGVGGALLGILLGCIVCLLQMHYGLITIQAQGSFIIDAYPVAVRLGDIILVFFTVSIISFAASWLPVSKIRVLAQRNSS